ncbi:MAG: hypothetical protein K8R85_11915 [Bacteroidetes bacterium]|nr:hypothetical protein [Bacteroidota bacterium]
MKTKVKSKVAEITLTFWLMKVIATTLGETLGDFISITLNFGYSMGIAITFLFFIISLLFQISSKKYFPSFFWLTIISTTTLGTELSDFIDRTLLLGYTLGSFILIVLLFIVLFLWKQRFTSILVYPILSKEKEGYFWVAVLLSNSLGTAFGDYLSDVLDFSYLTGAIITGVIIFAVILSHYYTKINAIALFWIAFIFTRPFGATFGDFLTKSHSKGGLDLGTLNATLVALFLMFVLVLIENKKLNLKEMPIKNS